MESVFDIYGIGSAIQDLQLRVGEEVIRELSLSKGEMRLVSSEEQERLLSNVKAYDNISKSSGGSAANSIILASQLGAKVSYCCLTGDDDVGREYRSEMQDLGIVLHAPPRQNLVTATSLVLITPDAERTMNTHLGVSAKLSEEDLDLDKISQSKWVYAEGYLLSQPNSYKAVKKALKHAKKEGVKFAFSFSDGFIVDCFRDTLEEIVSGSDLVFANSNEAKKYTRQETADLAFESLKKEVSGIALTLGGEGVKIFFEEQECFEPGITARALDTTGAGDAFAGAFLYGIVSGMSANKSAALGCLLAGRTVEQMGARLTNIPEC